MTASRLRNVARDTELNQEQAPVERGERAAGRMRPSVDHDCDAEGGRKRW